MTEPSLATALPPSSGRLVLGEPSVAPPIPDEAGPTRGQFIPAMVADDTRIGDVFLRGASIQGAKNRNEGLPRTDCYQFARSADGRWFAVVVCGGVAATGYSHLGSNLAAHYARGLLTEGETLSVKELASIPGQVEQMLANQFEGHETQIATGVTFLAFDTSDEMCYASRVGNGDVLVPRDNLWRSVFPDTNEQTGAAVLPGGSELAQRARFPYPVGATAVIGTGGVTAAMSGPPNEVGAAFWNSLTEPLALDAYLQLVNFDRAGCDTDRTLVTLWRMPIDLRATNGS